MTDYETKNEKRRYSKSILFYSFSLLVFVFPWTLRSGGFLEEKEFAVQKANFYLAFKDLETNLKTIAIFVLPNENLPLKVYQGDGNRSFSLVVSSGDVRQTGLSSWIWTAPSRPGLYKGVVRETVGGDPLNLHLFVMVPYSQIKNGVLNGYKIGRYPEKPLNNSPLYAPPSGFVEITEENQDTLVSPHFKISQFLCKQPGGFPKYLVLKEKLVLELENLLETVNQNGFSCSTLRIMSGYRTPYYNSRLGNVRYSRHMWGDAADVYVDADPVDDIMDDLNADGNFDKDDAHALAHMIETRSFIANNRPFQGGLKAYKATGSHGPFVHVDTRGETRRW